MNSTSFPLASLSCMIGESLQEDRVLATTSEASQPAAVLSHTNARPVKLLTKTLLSKAFLCGVHSPPGGGRRRALWCRMMSKGPNTP